MQVEVQVLQPMWVDGKQIEPEEGRPAPVVALSQSDANYLASIGRVRIIDAEAKAEPAEAKPKKAASAK